MSERWKVMGLPLESFNESGSKGEPFAAIQLPTGTIVLTKEVYFSESDEERSSVHHPQQARERG